MKLHLPQSLMALLLTAYACFGEQWSRPVYELTGNTITVTGNITYPAQKPVEPIWNDVYASAVGNVTVTGNGVISGSVPWDDDEGISLSFNYEATSILLDQGVTFKDVQIQGGGGFYRPVTV